MSRPLSRRRMTWILVGAGVALFVLLAAIAVGVRSARDAPATPPADVVVGPDEPAPVGRDVPPTGQRLADDLVWGWLVLVVAVGPVLVVWLDRRRRRDEDDEGDPAPSGAGGGGE